MTDHNSEPENLEELSQLFRQMKHDVNNRLAVIMALAEMTKRKPEYAERLADSVLTRGTQLVEDLKGFGDVFTRFVDKVDKDAGS